MNEALSTKRWCVYLIECENGAYYCGVTTDVQRRWQQHVSGKGAKYTRAQRPVRMKLLQGALSQREALQQEYRIKQLQRSDKEMLWHAAKWVCSRHCES